MRTTTSPVIHPPVWLRPVLVVDGIGSLLAGVVLLVAPGWLTAGLGLATDGPVLGLGALFVVNGVVNLRAARARSARSLWPAVAIDLGFATAVVAVAIGDPFTSAAWARWLAAGMGLASLDLGLLKWWASRRISVAVAPARPPVTASGG